MADFTISLNDQQTLLQDGTEAETIGNWANFYRDLLAAITNSTTQTPALNVDVNAWIWVAGAVSVNSGSGPLGQYIRSYTATQYALRAGTTPPDIDARLQQASNDIAANVLDTLIKNNWVMPSLDTLGAIDAAAAAARVFKGAASSTGAANFSPWAGTVNFVQLGNSNFFNNWVLTNGINQNKVEGGTYDLVSIAEDQAQNQTLGLAASTAFSQGGLAYLTLLAGGTAVADATANANTFFVNTYGNAASGIDIGSSIFSLSSSATNGRQRFMVGTLKGESISVGPSQQVVVGGPGGNTFNAWLTSGPFAPTSFTTRILDGGLGTNTLSYANSTAELHVALQRVQRSVSVDDPAYQSAPTTFVQVTDKAGSFTDNDYNFQTFTLGSGKNTFLIDAGVTKDDLLNKDGTPIIKSVDGGSSGDNTLDLRKFDGSLTASVSKPADGSASPLVFNVLGLLGDGAIAASDFQTLKLGSGDDSFSVQDGVDISTLKAVDGGGGVNTLRYAVGTSGLDTTFAPAPTNPDGTPATAPWAAQITLGSNSAHAKSVTNFQVIGFDTKADTATLTGNGADALGLSGSVHGIGFSDAADAFKTTDATEIFAGDGQSFTGKPNTSSVLLAGDGNTLAGSAAVGLYVVAGSGDAITLPDSSAATVIAPEGGAGSTTAFNTDWSTLALRSSPGLVTIAGQYNWVYGGVQTIAPIAGQDEYNRVALSGAPIINDPTDQYGYSTTPSGGHSDVALDGDFNVFELVSGDAAVTATGDYGIILAYVGTGPMSLDIKGNYHLIEPSDHSTVKLKGDYNRITSQYSGSADTGVGTVANVIGNDNTIILPGLTATVSGDHNFVVAEAYGTLNVSGAYNFTEIDSHYTIASPEGGPGGPAQVNVSGSDSIVADSGSGNDTINAVGDRFSLFGGNGTDTLTTTGNSSNLVAGSGDTTLVANGTGNTLVGSSGNDTLQILSGSGNRLVGGTGNNMLDGGSGSNTADYSAAPAGVVVDLGAGTASNGYGGTDTLKDIHSVVGSIYADMLTGTAAADTFDGYGSDDLEVGNGGADTFIFNTGYGQLEVSEDAGSSNTSSAILQFGAGVSVSQVVVTADSSGNVYLTDDVAGDRVMIDGLLNLGQGGYAQYGLAQVQFADSTAWTQNQLTALAGMGTAGSDTIAGTSGNDLLDGRGGGDTISGGGGYDIYFMRQGYGMLTVDNSTAGGKAPQGEVDFGAGITSQNLWLSQSGSDLMATVLGSADVVDLKGWFGADPSAQVAAIKGYDGLKLDSSVGQLVTAMAAYAASNPGFDPTAATVIPADPSLRSALAGAWHG